MKSCEQYELLASLVLDGEASKAEQAELTVHLETCPACRAYFEDIRRIHETFAREEIVVPEGFAVRVMDRVRETEQDRPEENKKVIPFPHWKRWAALAACCAVIALGAWAARGGGGVEGVIATDKDVGSSPQVSVDAQSAAGSADHDGPAPHFDEDKPVDDAASVEAAQSMPEEYAELAKSAARDGADEGQYKPVATPQTEQELTLASSPPPDGAAVWEETDALPAYERDADYDTDHVEAEESMEDDVEPVPEDGDSLEAAIAPAAPADGPESPDEPVEAVEPVEIIGVPEPGILIAYGTAAQAWVENALGLEWAAGGSYPLTAEQYGDLLRVLDESGEDYSVADGDGYCLMTE